MAREITTTGSKKVATLMKEFNANFPYLMLRICPPESKELVAKGKPIYGVDSNKTLSEVRTKKGAGEISLTGSKHIATLEQEFETVFGLFIQICYTSKEGKRYYTSGAEDKKSLSKLNNEKEAEGCQKNQWE
jgi:hypothetical protein